MSPNGPYLAEPRLAAAVLAAALLVASPAWGQGADSDAGAVGTYEQGRELAGPGVVLPERERPGAVNRMLEERLETLLPRLMRETGIELWLVIAREYNEDPVYLTLVPEPVFAARRTTMLVFHDRGEDEGVDLLTVSRYPLGPPYEAAWEGGDLDAQWAGLAEVLAERDPETIGVNVSDHWPVVLQFAEQADDD